MDRRKESGGNGVDVIKFELGKSVLRAQPDHTSPERDVRMAQSFVTTKAIAINEPSCVSVSGKQMCAEQLKRQSIDNKNSRRILMFNVPKPRYRYKAYRQWATLDQI